MGVPTGRKPLVISVEIRPGLDAARSRAWDSLVSRTEYSDLTQLTCWARLRGTAGFRPTNLLAWRGDELLGGAQILSRRVPMLGSVGYLPYGPLIASGPARPETVGAFGAALERCAARMTALFVQPPHGADDVSTNLLRRGFRASEAGVAPAASLALDLSVGEDQLRKGLDSRIRGWTNRWPSRGVTVREGDENDVGILADLISVSAEHQGYRPLSWDYLLGYYRELAPRGLVALFVGEIAGDPVAARLYTICGGVLKARLAGMDRSSSASRLSVPAAIEWHAIRWAKSRNLRWFDCGGIRPSTAELLLADRSVSPSDVTGSDWFKIRFGGSPFLYPQAVERIRSPIVRMGYDQIRRSRRAHAGQQLLRRLVRGGTNGARAASGLPQAPGPPPS